MNARVNHNTVLDMNSITAPTVQLLTSPAWTWPQQLGDQGPTANISVPVPEVVLDYLDKNMTVTVEADLSVDTSTTIKEGSFSFTLDVSTFLASSVVLLTRSLRSGPYTTRALVYLTASAIKTTPLPTINAVAKWRFAGNSDAGEDTIGITFDVNIRQTKVGVFALPWNP